MVEEEKGLYARAHSKILELIPMLKGETVSREQWWRLCNINPTNQEHIPFKDAINDALNKMSKNKNPLIVKNGSGYKVVNDELIPINFKERSGDRLDLVMPFGIHNYGFLYRKNIMIVSGSKDAGKTAFMLNMVRMNMNRHRVVYWSSEMVGDEFANRLEKAEGIELNDWCFEAFERSYDFDQVIIPSAVNIIDYLELGGDEAEYYKGVSLVRKIYDRLDDGVAIIACQKNKDAELPKGGSGLLEKARIAVSLDQGKATLNICKNWADGITSNPRGKQWSYKIVGGINYNSIKEYCDYSMV